MLGEAATKEIAVNRDVQGFGENKQAAQMGGRIAGNARHELEQESGKSIVSKDNYLGRRLSGPDEPDLLEAEIDEP
jgi:DNA-damage-inducible protein D